MPFAVWHLIIAASFYSLRCSESNIAVTAARSGQKHAGRWRIPRIGDWDLMVPAMIHIRRLSTPCGSERALASSSPVSHCIVRSALVSLRRASRQRRMRSSDLRPPANELQQESGTTKRRIICVHLSLTERAAAVSSLRPAFVGHTAFRTGAVQPFGRGTHSTLTRLRRGVLRAEESVSLVNGA